MIGACGTAGCIGPTAIAAVIAAFMGVWALGYGIGKALAWTRKIASAA